MLLGLQQELYLVSSLITVFCAGMMLKFERRFNKGMHFLTLANLTLMLIPLISYIQIKLHVQSPLISQIANNCILLFCGLCYLFYRFKSKPNLSVVFLHCAPFFIFLVVKVAGFHAQTELMYIIYFGLMFSYLTAIWHSHRDTEADTLQGDKRLLAWIIFVVILNGGVAISFLSGALFTYPLWLTLNISICIYLLIFSFKAVYHIKHVQQTHEIEHPSAKKQLQLSPSIAQSCIDELKQLLEEEQVFLDNQLTLAQLADQLGLTQHQTSELLNEHMNKSFYTLLNEHRIHFACELLKKSTTRNNITQIALDSGFNNKSSFYTEFKKQLGTTPSKWRAQYA
ncbi:helix-turn-helix domain-containing protein [Pseudoalteromonas luteoviolacea]|uniref:helix-turn-helix domain-containing protein n=1 Tax=Pseudoalteromonas luteoviolacea TaxID=43657 RepID=UPI001F3C7F36|nr:helix-turn-helix domain-containing protein [Pseudoalteromonas luteoviolacea]MCF6440747.1 helix-turn-helix domain-containing protein [Pseudoalteromonas luteoviolacea]